jgi:uncharacterized protein
VVISSDLHRFEYSDVSYRKPHPKNVEAQILVERLAAAGERLVPSAEVLQEILRRYTAITQNHPSLSARDSLHIAVMERRGVRSILSFDADFDRWPGFRRIYQI